MTHSYLLERSSRWLIREDSYPYLPSATLLALSGYEAVSVARYEHKDGPYIICMLSQTSMALLYYAEKIIDGQLVSNDKELKQFLADYDFPPLITE